MSLHNMRRTAGILAGGVAALLVAGAAVAGNATRLLVLPTLHTNAEQGRLDALTAELDQLRDPNLAATVHFYGWWPFSVNIVGGTRYDSNVEQDLIGTFDRVRSTFVSRGIPVIIGEWALLNWDHNRPGVIERGEFLKFLEAVGYHARTRNLNDGAVTLTFHFWSGTQVTYRLTKSGSSVTGSTT